MNANLRKQLRAILKKRMPDLKKADEICALFVDMNGPDEPTPSRNVQELEAVHGRAHNEFPCGEVTTKVQIQKGYREMLDTLRAIDQKHKLSPGLTAILMIRFARHEASTAWEGARRESIFYHAPENPPIKQQ